MLPTAIHLWRAVCAAPFCLSRWPLLDLVRAPNDADADDDECHFIRSARRTEQRRASDEIKIHVSQPAADFGALRGPLGARGRVELAQGPRRARLWALATSDNTCSRRRRRRCCCGFARAAPDFGPIWASLRRAQRRFDHY